jgi:hypothetical protein
MVIYYKMYGFFRLEHRHNIIEPLYMKFYITRSLIRDDDIVLQFLSNKCFASLVKPYFFDYKLHNDKFISHPVHLKAHSDMAVQKKLIEHHIQSSISSNSTNAVALWESYILLTRQLSSHFPDIVTDPALLKLIIKANFILIVL